MMSLYALSSFGHSYIFILSRSKVDFFAVISNPKHLKASLFTLENSSGISPLSPADRTAWPHGPTFCEAWLWHTCRTPCVHWGHRMPSDIPIGISSMKNSW